MEKVAQAGAVTLKHAGRSMLVEQVEDGQPESTPSTATEPASPKAALRDGTVAPAAFRVPTPTQMAMKSRCPYRQ